MGFRAYCCALSIFGVTSLFSTPLLGQAPGLGAAGQLLSAVRPPLGLQADGFSEGSIDQAPQVSPARGRGALWGAGIGAVAGGLLGGLTVESDEGSEGSLVEASATGEAVVLGALVGAGLGALLGATVFAPSRASASPDGGPAFSVVPVASFDQVGTVVRIRW